MKPVEKVMIMCFVRLYRMSAWWPTTGDTESWWQVDFSGLHYVTAVLSQGKGTSARITQPW